MNAKQLRAKAASKKQRFGRNLAPRVSERELVKMVEKRGGKIEKVAIKK